MQGISGIATGLITGDLTSIVSGVVGLLNYATSEETISDVEKLSGTLDALQSNLKLYQNLLNDQYGADFLITQHNILDNLRAEKTALEELIEAEKNAVKVKKFLGIEIKKVSITNWDTVHDYENQVNELNDQIIETMKEAMEVVTGLSMESITNPIVEMFESGKMAAEDFSKVTEDIVRNMLFNLFKTQYLEPEVKKLFDSIMSEFTSAFGTDERGDRRGEEIDISEFLESDFVNEMIGNINGIIGQVTPAFEALNEIFKKIFGEGLADTEETETGLAGAIKQQITEETASIIAGQINAMQINVIEQLNTFRESVVVQKQIAANTLRSANLLETIVMKVSSVDELRGAGL
jgi:hypothetical protein